MNLAEFLILLLVAGVCGSLGQSIAGSTRGGCLASIAVGFIGALLGMWIARQLSLPEFFAVQIGGSAFPIVWSVLGSALFVAVIAMFSRGRPGSGKG